MRFRKDPPEADKRRSRFKLQYCQHQVEYLERLISQGTIALSPSQLEGVSKVPCSRTVGKIMIFLGMTGFNAEWIEDYVVKCAALREIIKQSREQKLKVPLKWTNEAMVAFETL